MQLKRLLIVSEPGTYGVFHYVRNLIEFAGRKHPETVVDFAYSTRRGSPALLELVRQVEQRGGRTLDLHVGNAPEAADLAALQRLLGLVFATKPDLIHANSSKAGGLCRLLKLVPGLPPVLYSPHAYYGMRQGAGLGTRVFNGIERVLGPFGRTLTYCADERDFGRHTLRQPSRKVVLIHHGIDLERFSPVDAQEKLRLRASFNIPADVPLLVTVGRQSFQKNYDALYAALAPLLDQARPPFRLAHAGEGADELAKTLPPAARAWTHPFEFLPDVHRLLNAADAFVMTSRYETLCLAALEAMACGLKIFLSRVVGLSSYAQLGFDEIGWIEPAQDPGQFVENIRRGIGGWFATPAVSQVPLQQQVKRVRSWFDRDVQFEKHWRLYSRLAENRRGR
jgi:glycosyltransferase involved in cell wall biosynthesis